MLARLFDRAVPQVAVSHRLPQHAPAPHGSSNQQRAAVHTWARGKRRRDAGPFPSLGADTEVEDFILEDEGVFDDNASFEQQLAAAARQQRLARLRRLQQLYGPHFSDSDVRLYLKKRSLNNGKARQYRKGGLPLDDSLPRPGTLAKFPETVKAIILQERAAALSTSCRLPLAATSTLYRSLPGLFCYTNLEVAHMLRGLAAVLDRSVLSVVPLVLTQRRLMMVHPDALETRVGLLARLLGVDRRAAAKVLLQEEHLLVVNIGQLADRCEELALLLHVEPSHALQLLGQCAPLVTAPLKLVQQQLQRLTDALGPRVGPQQLLRLLRWQPLLLVGPAWQQLSQSKVKLPPHVLKRVVSQALKQLQPGQSMSAALMAAAQQQQQQQQQQQRHKRPAADEVPLQSGSVASSSSSSMTDSTYGWDGLDQEEEQQQRQQQQQEEEGNSWDEVDDMTAAEDDSLGDLSDDAVYQDLLQVFDSPSDSDSDGTDSDLGDLLGDGWMAGDEGEDAADDSWLLDYLLSPTAPTLPGARVSSSSMGGSSVGEAGLGGSGEGWHSTVGRQDDSADAEAGPLTSKQGEHGAANTSSSGSAGGDTSASPQPQALLQQLAQQWSAPVDLTIEQVAEAAHQLASDLGCHQALAVHMVLACPPVLLLTQQQAVQHAVRELQTCWLFAPQAVQQRQQYLLELQELGVVKQRVDQVQASVATAGPGRLSKEGPGGVTALGQPGATGRAPPAATAAGAGLSSLAAAAAGGGGGGGVLTQQLKGSDLVEVLSEQPALLLLAAHQAQGLQQQLEALQAALVGWVAAGEAHTPGNTPGPTPRDAPPAVAVAAASQVAAAAATAEEVQQLVMRAPWLLAEQPAAVVRRLEVLGGVLNCTPQQQRQGLWQGVLRLPQLLRLELTGANRVLKTLTSLLGCSVTEVKQALVAPPSVETPGPPLLAAEPVGGGTAAAASVTGDGSGSGRDVDRQGYKVPPLGLLLMERSRVRAAFQELQQGAAAMGMEGEQLQQMLLQHPERLLRH